jgi:ABC-type lipoprotein export system ATPase subunit
MQIQVSNLHKSYLDGEGRRLHILRGINFEAESGSSVAILGASGTGKSTFLHTLGTLESIDEGTLYLDGSDLTSLSRDQAAQFRNEEVGFIFQFHQLLQDFSALENVMIPQLIKGNNSGVVRKNALELLDRVGLADRTGHKPSQLSGGEQQRVAIARALVNRPRIVLADEPTGNLDEDTSAQVMDVLLRLNRENETTFIMITHNTSLASAMQFQHRMENGQLHLLPNA